MRNICVNYFEFGPAVHKMMFKGFSLFFAPAGFFSAQNCLGNLVDSIIKLILAIFVGHPVTISAKLF